jgi:hypothetical protein
MKPPSATMPTDEKWATRLERLLVGGFSEAILEATVLAPDKTELFKCPGVLEVDNGHWILRLFRRKESKGLGHFMRPEVPVNATYGKEDRFSAVLQLSDHTEATLEGIWPTDSSQSGSGSWYHETRHKAHVLTTEPSENPVCSLHPDNLWMKSLVHGFIPGVKLPYTLHTGAKLTLELPVIGERSHSRCVWSDQREGWAWLAVDDDRGLAIYLEEYSGLSEKEARANLDALMLALGFVMGRQLSCCYAAVEWCGKKLGRRELAPPEGPGGTILLPLIPAFAERNHRWTYDLVRASYDFLKNRELPIVKLVTNCMLQVYRSAHPVVPTDTQMLVLCTRLEKLVKVLACASKYTPASYLTSKPKKSLKGMEAVKRRAMWRHVASLLDISWDKGMKPVHYSWEKCRHALAHGNPEVFASMEPDEAFRHRYRLQGGFNALLAGIFRCQSCIRISPMETELEARVGFTITATSDQEWDRRIVTILRAVTSDTAGYSADSDLDT